MKGALPWLRKAERAGLTLLLICVAALGWSGWYVGPAKPDRSIGTELGVLTAHMDYPASLAAEPDRALIRAGKLVPAATRRFWAGTLRVFAAYQATGGGSKDVDAAIAVGLENLRKWERRRGEILLAVEQPVKIGTVLFTEVEPRYFTRMGWTHLRHEYDPTRLQVAALIGCLTLLAYALLRLAIVLLAAAYAFVATGAIPSWAARFED